MFTFLDHSKSTTFVSCFWWGSIQRIAFISLYAFVYKSIGATILLTVISNPIYLIHQPLKTPTYIVMCEYWLPLGFWIRVDIPSVRSYNFAFWFSINKRVCFPWKMCHLPFWLLRKKKFSVRVLIKYRVDQLIILQSCPYSAARALNKGFFYEQVYIHVNSHFLHSF